MAWTVERVELLKKLWSEGLSASQIAGRLGGVTRNAVIGKVHRLGLSGRATTSRIKQHRPRTRLATQPKRQPTAQRARYAQTGNPTVRALYGADVETLPQVEEIDIPLTQRKTLQSLTVSSCRWPVGDPQTPEFYFCGGEAVAGLPYCECHARRAFQPPQPKRREREAIDAVRMAIQRSGRPQSVDSEAETSDA
ncbi:MAG: GcrA family cell cycle regulator [Hyphomicrobiaceae bacterium]|nr:GcrA family cell cycle regulator [Hyphomicrobiaceae bacterium]